jgi:hypothetical protein
VLGAALVNYALVSTAMTGIIKTGAKQPEAVGPSSSTW